MLKLQTLKKNIKGFMDNPVDGWYFIQGEVRLFLDKYLPFMIRPSIKAKIEARKKAAKKCLENGSCVFCGCTTPDLFYANKACGLSKISDPQVRFRIAGRTTPCYPKM